jgi:putative transposase
MNRGHNRETVFADDEDRGYFLQLLARYRDRFALRRYHYCLMSNHFHLLLQLPQP